jgi:hypothetical protein
VFKRQRIKASGNLNKQSTLNFNTDSLDGATAKSPRVLREEPKRSVGRPGAELLLRNPYQDNGK